MQTSNTPPFSVAMVVHNTVVGDARIRKEAATLTSHGVKLDIVGWSKENVSYPQSIDGAQLTIACQSQRTHGRIREATISCLKKAVAISSSRKALVPVFILSSLGSFLLGLKSQASAGIATTVIVFSIAILGLTASGLALKHAAPMLSRRLRAQSLAVRFNMIAQDLLAVLEKKRYDVLHCHDIIGLIAGLSYKAKHPGTQLIWDAHELYTELSYSSGGTNNHINKIIADAAAHIDGFITISESFAMIYRERYPQLPSAHVLMNATMRATPFASRPTKLQEAAAIAPDQKILLFQGGLAKGRGIDKLIAVIPLLPDDWSLVFMSKKDGHFSQQIENVAAEVNASRPHNRPAARIIPQAPWEELALWTGGATLGVILYENTNMNHLYCTPNKLWEYPNAQVPILAHDLVELQRIISTHKTGLLVSENESVEQIAEMLRQLDDKQLQQLQQNCLQFSQTECWEKYEPVLLGLYEKLVGQHSMAEGQSRIERQNRSSVTV